MNQNIFFIMPCWFQVPFISGASKSCDIKAFEDDGFEFVEKEVVAMKGNMSCVHEQEDFEIFDHNGSAIVSVAISDIQSVKFGMIGSSHDRFAAGRARIVEVFDASRGEKRLTFEMPLDDCNRFVEVIESLVVQS